jgi:hypothetical protein
MVFKNLLKDIWVFLIQLKNRRLRSKKMSPPDSGGPVPE